MTGPLRLLAFPAAWRERCWPVLASFGLALVLFSGLWFLLPDPLFRVDYSTLVLDAAGRPVGATISADGQWRFPPDGAVGGKFKQALLMYEDRRFYLHPGVDMLALLRAVERGTSKWFRFGATPERVERLTAELMPKKRIK